jgi:hypothetical protein
MEAHRVPAGDADRALAVQAMLAEYNSLRQESMSSITNRVTIANFTFGAVAIILAALLAQPRPTVLIGMVAIVFVPQISKVGLMIWLGEYTRSQRAGKWIAHLEHRISETIAHDRVMAWESTLLGIRREVLREEDRQEAAAELEASRRSRVTLRWLYERARWAVWKPAGNKTGSAAPVGRSAHMRYPYLSVVLLLLGVGWASTIIGTAILVNALHGAPLRFPWLLVSAMAALVIIVVELRFYRVLRDKWAEIHMKYSKYGENTWATP